MCSAAFTTQVTSVKARKYRSACLPIFPLLRKTNFLCIKKLMISQSHIEIRSDTKYALPPWISLAPIMYHGNSIPKSVISIRGKPTASVPRNSKAGFKTVTISPRMMVIKLLTRKKSPPSLTHSDTLGCFCAKPFQSCFNLFIHPPKELS